MKLERKADDKTRLIINQCKIPKKKWRYGFRSSAATGCGWVATYNALQLLGYDAEPRKLIRFYSWMLPLLNGNFGTAFWCLPIFFKMHGFRIKVSLRRKKFDEMVRSADVCVLSYSWRRKWKYGAHYVTLHEKQGQIIGYNTYTNSIGPDVYGESLAAFLKERKYFWPMLIAIEERKEGKLY